LNQEIQAQRADLKELQDRLHTLESSRNTDYLLSGASLRRLTVRGTYVDELPSDSDGSLSPETMRKILSANAVTPKMASDMLAEFEDIPLALPV